MAMPAWVLPSGFVLVGLWDLVEWTGDHKPFRLSSGIVWIVLGVIHWLRVSYLKRRIAALDRRLADLQHHVQG